MNKEWLQDRKRLTFLTVGGIVVFFTLLFIFYASKVDWFRKKEVGEALQNNTIVFEQPKLNVFNDLYFLNEFPDTVRIHAPYVIVVIPEHYKQITTVYDERKKAQVASLNEIVLDYDKGNWLYNQNGLTTFYNQQSLGLHCTQGFIQNPTSIFCITAKNGVLGNKLISINTKTLVKQDVYSSQNYLTAVTIINGNRYIGEFNLTTKKAYLRVADTPYEVPVPVDIVYPMQSKVYFATFKSVKENKEGQYYLFDKMGNNFAAKLAGTGKIVIYRP